MELSAVVRESFVERKFATKTSEKTRILSSWRRIAMRLHRVIQVRLWISRQDQHRLSPFQDSSSGIIFTTTVIPVSNQRWYQGGEEEGDGGVQVSTLKSLW